MAEPHLRLRQKVSYSFFRVFLVKHQTFRSNKSRQAFGYIYALNSVTAEFVRLLTPPMNTTKRFVFT